MAVYRVAAGSLVRYYATEYHAQQLARALELHGLAPEVSAARLPDDALTRLTVSGMGVRS